MGSVDLAVQELVEEYLDEEDYCTVQDLQELRKILEHTKEAIKEARELFESELKSLHDDISRLTNREDRMWDILHQQPAINSKFNKFRSWISKLVFWR